MKQNASISVKRAVCIAALLFAAASAAAYCAKDGTRSSGLKIDTTAPAAGPMAGADEAFHLAVRKPGADGRPMSGEEKFRYYLKQTYGPQSKHLIPLQE